MSCSLLRLPIMECASEFTIFTCFLERQWCQSRLEFTHLLLLPPLPACPLGRCTASSGCKTPFQNPVLDDSLRSLVSFQSSDDCCVVHRHSPAREVEIEAAHNEGYQLFCNSGHYSAAVALNRNLAARVVWHDTCDFEFVVILGCSANILVISAFLPNPGLGLDLYLQALAATNDWIKSAPRDFMFLGCDGNCKLFNHSDLDHVVGPLIYPGQSVRSGDRELSEAFIALALEHCLRAANTFRPTPLGLPL